jgi:hypothetical protein
MSMPTNMCIQVLVKSLALTTKRDVSPVLITCAVYGLQHSDKAWRDQMAATLWDFAYSSCKVDSDVWMHLKVMPESILRSHVIHNEQPVWFMVHNQKVFHKNQYVAPILET